MSRHLPRAAAFWRVRTLPPDPYLAGRTQARCAGAVWLVSLLVHCGRHPRLVAVLPRVQEALCALLGDTNELTQVGRGL